MLAYASTQLDRASQAKPFRRRVSQVVAHSLANQVADLSCLGRTMKETFGRVRTELLDPTRGVR